MFNTVWFTILQQLMLCVCYITAAPQLAAQLCSLFCICIQMTVCFCAFAGCLLELDNGNFNTVVQPNPSSDLWGDFSAPARLVTQSHPHKYTRRSLNFGNLIQNVSVLIMIHKQKIKAQLKKMYRYNENCFPCRACKCTEQNRIFIVVVKVDAKIKCQTSVQQN